MTLIFPSSSGPYRRDSEENWFLREDVAGYEYPEEGYNYRIGVTREVMQEPRDLEPLFAILNTPFTESVSINMARIVLARKLLLRPPRSLRPLLAVNIESIISLEDSGNDELADCYQVVFSRHHPSRQTPEEVVRRELETAERIFTSARTKPVDPSFLSRSRQACTIERITATSNPQLIRGYEELTEATFGYGSEEREMLQDENTILLGAVEQREGQLHVIGGAFAMQDITYLRREGSDIALTTYEISGVVVMEKHRGQGLYKELCVMLLTHLARLHEPVDIVFSYLNLQEPAVLAVAAGTGHILVTEIAQKLNLSLKPSMQLNTVNGKYVDDIVAYIPGGELRSRYGKE